MGGGGVDKCKLEEVCYRRKIKKRKLKEAQTNRKENMEIERKEVEIHSTRKKKGKKTAC